MVRIKHRYITVHVLYPSQTAHAQAAITPLLHFHCASPAGLDAAHLLRLIRKSIEYMYGDYGLGLIASSLKINYWSAATSTAILRVARAHFRIVWGALTWITDMGHIGAHRKEDEAPKACVFRVVRTSGTIKKAEEDVIRRAREEIRKAKISHMAADNAWLTLPSGAGKNLNKQKLSQDVFKGSAGQSTGDSED